VVWRGLCACGGPSLIFVFGWAWPRRALDRPTKTTTRTLVCALHTTYPLLSLVLLCSRKRAVEGPDTTWTITAINENTDC